MPEENGAAIKWRLTAAERGLEALDARKADSKDVDGLATVVRDGVERIEKRLDHIEADGERDRQDAAIRQRTLLVTFATAAVTIIGSLIGSGAFN